MVQVVETDTVNKEGRRHCGLSLPCRLRTQAMRTSVFVLDSAVWLLWQRAHGNLQYTVSMWIRYNGVDFALRAQQQLLLHTFNGDDSINAEKWVRLKYIPREFRTGRKVRILVSASSNLTTSTRHSRWNIGTVQDAYAVYHEFAQKVGLR